MNTQSAVRRADILDENFLHQVKDRLLERGASDAVVSARRSRAFEVSVRNGEFQDIGHDEAESLTLKAYVGKRSAAVSSNELSAGALETLVDRVVRMAELASEDPYAGLPPPTLLSAPQNDALLENSDPCEPALEELERDAFELERHALAIDGISDSQGATAAWRTGEIRSVASNGLSLHATGTQSSCSARLIASLGEARETGGFGQGARWRSDLLPLEEIGRRAGHAAAEKLGSRKIVSCTAPVIFDRKVSFAPIKAFLSAIGGNNIYYKRTFLEDPVGQAIFAKGFSLIEDPFRKRGLASRATDADGMAPFAGAIVEDGVVQTQLIGYYESRKLDRNPTGHSGGTGNLTVPAGLHDRRGMMREAGAGLIVTGIMGASGNPHTGDFSMGVSGLWFEQGEIAYPVSEITIAGNYKDLFKGWVVGSDLEYLGSNNAPSLLVQPLAIGGK